jgi:PLP dependent protein
MTLALYTENLRFIHEKIDQLKTQSTVRLLVISKNQSIKNIQSIYSLGERYFGENYVQELLEKAPQLPSDIKWSFVGSLQKNKCKALLSLKNLQRISTLDSIELASKIQKICKNVNRTVEIMIQVKIFDEKSKHGNKFICKTFCVPSNMSCRNNGQ